MSATLRGFVRAGEGRGRKRARPLDSPPPADSAASSSRTESIFGSSDDSELRALAGRVRAAYAAAERVPGQAPAMGGREGIMALPLGAEEESTARRMEETARRAEERAARRAAARRSAADSEGGDEEQAQAMPPPPPRAESTEPVGGATPGDVGAHAAYAVKGACMEPCCAPLLVERQSICGTESRVESAYCMLCEQRVDPDGWKRHVASTLHQLNRASPLRASSVWLPPSNRGYRMMEGMGWDEEQPLGRRGDGRMEPVPTTFKRDRRGLGHAHAPARVTHTPAHHEHEAHTSADGLSRAQRIAKRGEEGCMRAATGWRPGAPRLKRAQRRELRRRGQARDKRREAALVAEICGAGDLDDTAVERVRYRTAGLDSGKKGRK